MRDRILAQPESDPTDSSPRRDRRHDWQTCACGCWCGPGWGSLRVGEDGHAGRTAAGPGRAGAAAGQRVGRSGAEAVRLALDRPGEHGRPRRRHRRRSRAIPRPSTSASRRAASGRPSTTAPRGRRSSTSTRSPRSATSRSRRRTPTSSTSAPANRTTVRARRSAPASTSPPTAAQVRVRGPEGHAEHRRIVVHPKDPNIVYVAAVGHLFGPNAERGLFKTTDGGKTWTNTKFIDNDTGFTDVVMDPIEPEHALRRVVPAPAAAVGLQRRRSGQRHLEDDRRRQDVDAS